MLNFILLAGYYTMHVIVCIQTRQAHFSMCGRLFSVTRWYMQDDRKPFDPIKVNKPHFLEVFQSSGIGKKEDKLRSLSLSKLKIYRYHNHNHMSLSSSQPPPSVTIIITTNTICHYHHHNHHRLSLSSSSQPPPSFYVKKFLTVNYRNYQLSKRCKVRHQEIRDKLTVQSTTPAELPTHLSDLPKFKGKSCKVAL